MGELLPCPFCGKWPRRERYNGQWWLRCETCHFVSQPMETADAVDAWWNRRTPSAVLPSEPAGPGPTCGHCSKPWPCGCPHGENILRVLREKYPLPGEGDNG